MGFADNLRKEMNNKNAEIIADCFEPRKEEIFNIIATGIKRIGYVKIDTLCHAGTCEGAQLGINHKEINAFAEFLKNEGFKVQKAWWGYSSDGNPDMLTITL